MDNAQRKLLGDLERIANGFSLTATRTGYPGSEVRLQAAEDAAAVWAAHALIGAMLDTDSATPPQRVPGVGAPVVPPDGSTAPGGPKAFSPTPTTPNASGEER